MELHWIQNEILHRLNESAGLTFSELQLENMDNPQFNYHLKRLVDANQVEKNDQKYTITNDGVITLSKTDGSGASINQPKLSMLFIMKNKEGKHWVTKRDSRPFKDLTMFPTTKVISGKSMHEIANSYLSENLGGYSELELSGIFRRAFRPDNSSIDDRFFVVFSGTTTESGANFINTDDIEDSKIPSHLKLIRDELAKQRLIEIIDQPGDDKRY